MKKYLIMLGMVIAAIAANAQRNSVISLTVDTLQGAETVNFDQITFNAGYQSLVIQALCTELGGTADGNLWLNASVDGTSWVTVSDAAGLIKGFPNDTLTITDGAVWDVVIQDVPFKYYKVVGNGTASDTTKVTIKYIYK